MIRWAWPCRLAQMPHWQNSPPLTTLLTMKKIIDLCLKAVSHHPKLDMGISFVRLSFVRPSCSGDPPWKKKYNPATTSTTTPMYVTLRVPPWILKGVDWRALVESCYYYYNYSYVCHAQGTPPGFWNGVIESRPPNIGKLRG